MDVVHQVGFTMMAIGSIFSPCTEANLANIPDGPSPLRTTFHEFVGPLGGPGRENDLRGLVEQRNSPDAWVFNIPIGAVLRGASWSEVTDLACRYAGWTAHAAGHTGAVEVYAVPIVDAVCRFVAVPVTAEAAATDARERLRNVGLAH